MQKKFTEMWGRAREAFGSKLKKMKSLGDAPGIKAFDKYKIPIGMIISICACISGVTLLSGTKDIKPNEEIRLLSEQELASVKGIQEVDKDQKKLLIDIGGQVKSPGVIEVPEGVSVLEAVEQAGGFTDKADQAYIQKNINLAELVQDRQKIYVPAIGENETSANGNTNEAPNTNAALININTASTTELETLPGVGPSMSSKIIANRPYKKVEDIKNVPGIGDSTFNKLKPLIKV